MASVTFELRDGEHAWTVSVREDKVTVTTDVDGDTRVVATAVWVDGQLHRRSASSPLTARQWTQLRSSLAERIGPDVPELADEEPQRRRRRGRGRQPAHDANNPFGLQPASRAFKAGIVISTLVVIGIAAAISYSCDKKSVPRPPPGEILHPPPVPAEKPE